MAGWKAGMSSKEIYLATLDAWGHKMYLSPNVISLFDVLNTAHQVWRYHNY